MFPTLFTVDVLPYEGTDEDRFGNETPSFGTAVTKPVYGWSPAGTNEETASRHTVTADLQLLVPPDFTIDPRDRVVIEGATYEVIGALEDFNHGPFGFTPGGRVNLRRYE